MRSRDAGAETLRISRAADTGQPPFAENMGASGGLQHEAPINRGA